MRVVGTAITKMDSRRVCARPRRSPIGPKSTPPMGRASWIGIESQPSANQSMDSGTTLRSISPARNPACRAHLTPYY
jgi:hypothetical protein